MAVRLFRVLPVVLFAARRQHDNATVTLAARAADTLERTHRIAHCLVAHNQVDIADIETLLSNRGRHQHLDLAVAELGHDLLLPSLRQAPVSLGISRLADERSGADSARAQRIHNFGDDFAVRAEHHGTRSTRVRIAYRMLVKVVVQHVAQRAYLGVLERIRVERVEQR